LLGCEDETIEKALISSGQIDRFFAFFHGTANVLLSGVVIKVILPLLDTQYPDVCADQHFFLKFILVAARCLANSELLGWPNFF
jgi:hypothetical protein